MRHGCHCSMIWPADKWMPYLSQIECMSPKPGSSTPTGSLILETEADTVGRGKDRNADWPGIKNHKVPKVLPCVL